MRTRHRRRGAGRSAPAGAAGASDPRHGCEPASDKLGEGMAAEPTNGRPRSRQPASRDAGERPAKSKPRRAAKDLARCMRQTSTWASPMDCASREPARHHPASDSSRPPTGTRCVVTGKDGKARVTFKAPTALSEYRITARGVTGADTLAGQTTASLDGPQELLRRPQGARLAHAGRQAAVHRAGSPHGCRGQARASAGDLRRRSRRGLSQDASSSRGRGRRGRLRAVRGPRGRLGPADAHRHGRRRER